MLSIIVCTGLNGEIGFENDMPWKRGLPEDLKYFKRITEGHKVVMGRKTFESIGRPLPNRENIVLTRGDEFKEENAVICNNFEDVLSNVGDDEEIFIIGGGKLYSDLIDKIDKIYLTKINQEFEADTYFPNDKLRDFEEVARKKGERNEKNNFDYDFIVYERIVESTTP